MNGRPLVLAFPPPTTTTPGMYLVTDRRHDGRVRELERFVDLLEALRYAETLRAVGGYIEVQLVPTPPEAA